MSNSSDYSWTLFYPTVANALLDYKDRTGELLTLLYKAIPEETNYLHTPEGKKLEKIDPFSVFGILNRHISQNKKILVSETFKKIFTIDVAIPENFHGIPPLSNENSMFFSFKDTHREEDIDNLWELFISILKGTQETGALFDRMTTHQYGIKFNITLGMYWVSPNLYFPLDSPSRAFLRDHGFVCTDSKVPSFSDYQQLCNQVKKLLPKLPGHPENFAQVTRGIYLTRLSS